MSVVHHPLLASRRASGQMRSIAWLRELAVLGVAAAIYFGVRIIVEGSESRSVVNAERLLDLERALGIDVESSVQQLALEHDVLRVIGNLSYVWLHWPLLIAAFWILYHRDHQIYLRLRNATFASGLAGLVLFAVVPMSPPRFLPGYVGTVSDAARTHYLSYSLDWTNRFAAFPSFHVGWTLIACIAVSMMLRRRAWKFLALVPSVLVGVAVVSTGNHYILDSVTGAALACAAFAYFGLRTQREVT